MSLMTPRMINMCLKLIPAPPPPHLNFSLVWCDEISRMAHAHTRKRSQEVFMVLLLICFLFVGLSECSSLNSNDVKDSRKVKFLV